MITGNIGDVADKIVEMVDEALDAEPDMKEFDRLSVILERMMWLKIHLHDTNKGKDNE